MLDRKKYESCKLAIQNSTLDEKTIEALSNDYINAVLEHYVHKRNAELREEILLGKRFKSLFMKAVQNNLSYSIGMFAGIIKIFELLMHSNDRRDDFNTTMAALYAKSGVSNIVNYLYRHPDSQHRVICEKLEISKSYLSQLLRELEKGGCVERYATGKRSFYSLTIEGQAFVREKQQVKKSLSSVWFHGKYSISELDSVGLSPDIKYNDFKRKEKRDIIDLEEVICVGKY